MKLKTFLATYLLFLLVLFSCLGIISTRMTRAQTDMYAEKSAVEYQTIASALSRDMADLINWDGDYLNELSILVNNYASYYRRNNVIIELTSFGEPDDITKDTEISFIKNEQEHFVHITGILSQSFPAYRLDYFYNITDNITDMRRTQNTLVIICTAFSIITAFFLYYILSSIFKPLGIVAKTSRKIASGHYNERINIKLRSG